MTRYQALAATTVVATLVLITIGAVVRTTGSGLGCPDWPLCHGALLPPAERTAIIEYTHRSAAAIVGLLVLATVTLTLLQHRADRPLRNLAIASLPLLAFQAWLGKETVERELPAAVVTFHLGMALVLFAVLALIAAFAFLGPERRRIRDAERVAFLKLAIGVSALVMVVLLAGSYVVGADATTACTSWPGCSQAPIPFLDGVREQHIHWAHRLTVLAGFGGVALLIWRTQQLPGASSTLRTAAWGLGGLYVGQMLLGAANIWTDFSSASRAAHLAGAAAIWGLLLLIITGAAYRAGQRAPAREPSRLGPEREAARA